MNDQTQIFDITSSEDFSLKMLNWSKQFNIFCLLQNPTKDSSASFQMLLAVGVVQSVRLEEPLSYALLEDFLNQKPHWLFGHLNYPGGSDDTGFPPGYFFVPETVVKLSSRQLSISCTNQSPEVIYKQIASVDTCTTPKNLTRVQLQNRQTRNEYLQAIYALKQHIKRGDCYEINYCMDFFSTDSHIDPWKAYQQLTTVSPNPFAALYRIEDSFCICASPERFLKKAGLSIISQPIKGTSRRYPDDPEKDAASLAYLTQSEKEKSENVMVVDLVRNDLSRIATEGSVKVTELFAVYPFPQLYHLISTIQASIHEDTSLATVCKACFPMGSMTGAPKVKVMELIKQYEPVPRGLFSGTIGYVQPNGDADFNVVIRSVFFNQKTGLLCFKAGSGITFHSIPENEYDECMLKASAIMNMLMDA